MEIPTVIHSYVSDSIALTIEVFDAKGQPMDIGKMEFLMKIGDIDEIRGFPSGLNEASFHIPSYCLSRAGSYPFVATGEDKAVETLLTLAVGTILVHDLPF